MAHDDSIVPAPGPDDRAQPATVNTGIAVLSDDRIENPGFPPPEPRKTDEDPRAEQRASRQVVGWFVLSIIGAVFAIVAYIVFPITDDIGTVHPNNLWLGIGIAISTLALGIGAIHWSKQLMPNEEIVEERHPMPGDLETRAATAEIFATANEESGFGRRTLIRRTLIGAAIAAPLPGIVMLRDMGPAPERKLFHTMWDKGVRLTKDPDGTPILADDVTLGSAFHIIPDGLNEREDWLEQKAKAAVLLVRMPQGDLHERPSRASWSYNGIVAYSKICTHVGCPVALVEQRTHHLLCPCHQSTFDISDEAKVIFGPAKRPLPQLPITVDAEGYLVAQSDFTEPVGPSFWERTA